MTVRDACVPFDRLTALALAAPARDSAQDQELLAHVAACEVCSGKLAVLTAQVDGLRDLAWQEADAVFDEPALETQRAKILSRIAHLGKAARVLRFPARVREAAMPVSSISRRWISVAAAAGLIIGLVAGQMIHFVPWDSRLHRTPPPLQTTPRGSSGLIVVQTGSTIVGGSDDELLDEIDQAMQLRRAVSLRALDAFTPRVGDIVEIR